MKRSFLAFNSHPTVSGVSNLFIMATKEITTRTNVRIFKCTGLPTLLYGAETWVHHLRRLEAFQMGCLYDIPGIRFAAH
jgi:hypothetical protein